MEAAFIFLLLKHAWVLAVYLPRALWILELLPGLCLCTHMGRGRISILAKYCIDQNPDHQATSCVSAPCVVSGADQVVDRHPVCPRGLQDNSNSTIPRLDMTRECPTGERCRESLASAAYQHTG